MITPFDVWAPMFRAPFSGDVVQEIAPRVLSPEFKGIPEVEYKVQTEVASYGTQLGKILDALMILSEATKTPLPEIAKLVEDIEAVKTESVEDYRANAEEALKRLRRVDEDGWRRALDRVEASET